MFPGEFLDDFDVLVDFVGCECFHIWCVGRIVIERFENNWEALGEASSCSQHLFSEMFFVDDSFNCHFMTTSIVSGKSFKTLI